MISRLSIFVASFVGTTELIGLPRKEAGLTGRSLSFPCQLQLLNLRPGLPATAAWRTGPFRGSRPGSPPADRCEPGHRGDQLRQAEVVPRSDLPGLGFVIISE